MFPTPMVSIPVHFGPSFLESDDTFDSHDVNVHSKRLFMDCDWHSDVISPIVGPGFNNLGNSCFLNSVLQALIYMVPFSKAIITSDHDNCINYDEENFCALCSFRAVLREYVGSRNNAISPYALFNNLEKISSVFEKYVQEDAHSFLSFFLEKLETAYLKHYKKKDEDGLIMQTFGIHLQNMVKCLKCGHTAVNHGIQFDLSFDIQEVNSLEDALKAFVEVKRIIDPDLKRTCESCNEKVFMDEQIIINKLPMVLVVHLHGSDVNDGEFDKLYKDVDFPMNMNFMPYISTFQDEIYELYAVVVHKGGALCGHYFSFIRSYPNFWYLMEDSKVVRVSVEDVFQHNPFLLFYVKHGKSFCFSKLFKEIGSPTSTLDGLEVHCDPPNDLENRSMSDNLKSCVDERLREAGECSQRISDEHEHAPFDDGLDIAQECGPCSSESNKSSENEMRDSCSSGSYAGETKTCKTSSPDKRFVKTETSSNPFSSQIDANETAAVCETSDLLKSNQELHNLDLFADEVYDDKADFLAYTTLLKPNKVVVPVVKAVNGGAKHNTLNTMMRSMPNARRQAFMSCMPPQYRPSPGPQQPSKKKKRQM